MHWTSLRWHDKKMEAAERWTYGRLSKQFAATTASFKKARYAFAKAEDEARKKLQRVRESLEVDRWEILNDGMDEEMQTNEGSKAMDTKDPGADEDGTEY